ncbi:hypothetical protein HY798_03260 [Candidatus Falkowbacteria bacterium]|nr:hypothetical protein [Candidatus Falkowbacteria bacterium]
MKKIILLLALITAGMLVGNLLTEVTLWKIGLLVIDVLIATKVAIDIYDARERRLGKERAKLKASFM